MESIPHKKEIFMQVIKRNGTLEAFMPEKVVVSIVKSGAPYDDAKRIAATLAYRSDKFMETETIRAYVQSELKDRGYNASIESWTAYEREMKNNELVSPARRHPVKTHHV